VRHKNHARWAKHRESFQLQSEPPDKREVKENAPSRAPRRQSVLVGESEGRHGNPSGCYSALQVASSWGLPRKRVVVAAGIRARTQKAGLGINHDRGCGAECPRSGDLQLVTAPYEFFAHCFRDAGFH